MGTAGNPDDGYAAIHLGDMTACLQIVPVTSNGNFLARQRPQQSSSMETGFFGDHILLDVEPTDFHGTPLFSTSSCYFSFVQAG